MYVMYLRRSEGSRRCGHHPHAIVAISRSSSRSLGALRPDASFSQMKQPVRRAPVMARLDALAAGPATTRSGRPYPRQGPRKTPAGSRQHLDSRTAMGPVRRALPTARLDALAAGPATARSGRPYPRQSLGRRRPARQ